MGPGGSGTRRRKSEGGGWQVSTGPREREQLLLIGDIKLPSEGDVTGPGAYKGLIHSPTALTRSG